MFLPLAGLYFSLSRIYKNHKVRFEFHNHAQSTANVMYQRISFYIEHGQLTDRNSAYKIIRTLAQSFLVQHASGLITKTAIILRPQFLVIAPR